MMATRIRGDRPSMGGMFIYEELATPHTRGSTLGYIIIIERGNGYPAYAGSTLMNCMSKKEENGYPAYAGIDPIGNWTWQIPVRLPA